MALVKRSMRLDGHRTSLALEPSFWDAVDAIAKARGTSVPQVITSIDVIRTTNGPGIGPIDDTMSLASAVRVYVFELTAQRLATLQNTPVNRGAMKFGE